MILGFVGLPNAGKTTMFNNLTNIDVEVGYIHRNILNQAYVEIDDERLIKLKNIYDPQKFTKLGMEVRDFTPLEDEKEHKNFNVVEVKLVDVMALVLRHFNDDIIDEENGLPDPIKDLQSLHYEFIMSDLMIAENRLEKIRVNMKRGVKDNSLIQEEKLLERVVAHLSQESPIRELDLNKEEQRLIKSFQFLSNKPFICIINTDENKLKSARKLKQELENKEYLVTVVCGKYEMELLKLDENDASIFLKEVEFSSFAKDRIIELAFRALNYIHFYTVGKQEVRAWSIKQGMLAPEAAGKIHSDMEIGFIKAECFHYDDLIKYGSEKILKEKGLVRLEGKRYQVKDGDILIIRFNR